MSLPSNERLHAIVVSLRPLPSKTYDTIEPHAAPKFETHTPWRKIIIHTPAHPEYDTAFCKTSYTVLVALPE